LLEGSGVLLNIVAILALAIQIVGFVMLFRFSSRGPDLLLLGSVTYIVAFAIAVLKAVRKRKRALLAGRV
jgi:hypothetical protein